MLLMKSNFLAAFAAAHIVGLYTDMVDIFLAAFAAAHLGVLVEYI